MKNLILFKTLFLVIILVSVVSILQAEDIKKEYKKYSGDSAFLLPSGTWEIGLFQPLRFGFRENLEFSVHPISALTMPNISLKRYHLKYKNHYISSRHILLYPSPLLNMIAKEGIGGMISPEFTISKMLSISNEILISNPINENHLLSGKFAFLFALKSNDLDERTTIDLPLIYSRLNVFYNGYGIRTGVDLSGKLIDRVHYLLDMDLFLYPGLDNSLTFEQKSLLLWNKSERFQMSLGYKLIYGEYPFGSQWHLLLPLFDVKWIFNNNKNK